MPSTLAHLTLAELVPAAAIFLAGLACGALLAWSWRQLSRG